MNVTPMPSPAPRPGLPTWFLIALLAIAALAVALVAVILIVALGGDDDTDAGDTPGTVTEVVPPATFDVPGEMELYAPGNVLHYDGTCSGYEGYDDMIQGAQVVIRNSQGDTVGFGALEAGQPDGRSSCVFPFTVTGVPTGDSIYSVEVSHRGEIAFTQDEAEDGGLSLTLGD